MAYQALYRKYRPDCFENVAGQKPIIQTLQNAVRQHKTAHAYLFCGPRGTGKTSIAKIFAKMMNCESTEHAPCGHCQNCLAFQKGTHPDIIEIDAASNNGVDEVRNLIEKVKYAPMEGKYKVYIIDEVHMMSTGAFNALLKTIEEPPAHVIFIFATTEPHKVLPTIISRCQRFDFNKVSTADMIERLNYVLKQEQIEMEEEAVRIIATLADGGMRDALSILDQCIAYAQNHITVADVNTIYGITTPAEKGELIHHVLRQEHIELMRQIEAMNEKGVDIRRLTTDLIDLLKESVIYSYTNDAKLITGANAEVIQQVLCLLSIEQRFSMLDILMDTFEKYRNASDVASYFEVAMLKMFNFEKRMSTNSEQIETDAKPVKTQESAAETPQEEASIDHESAMAESTGLPPAKEAESSSLIKKDSQSELHLHHAESHTVSVPVQEPQPELALEEPPADAVAETEPTSDESSDKEQAVAADALFEAEPKQEAERELIVTDEYIIRLLSGANKQERQMDHEKFKELPQYLNELEWVKYANALKHTEIVASGRSYLVLSVEDALEAKEINQIEYKESFVSFTNQLLGIAKKVFAIDAEQKKRVIARFKELMIQGSLPEPVHVEAVVKKKKSKEPTTEEKLMSLFGDAIVMAED